MALGAVDETVDEAFLGGQAGDEGEVGFAGLDAELAGCVGEAVAQFEVGDALGLEQGFEDLRHALLLEDAPVRTQPGAGQLGLDHGLVAGAAVAGVALAEGADQAMYVAHRALAAQDGEQRGFVEQVGEVDVVFVADQFEHQPERGAEGFVQGEGDHLERVLAGQGLEAVAQFGLIRHGKSLSAF